MKQRRKVELAIDDLKRFALGANRDSLGFSGYRIVRNLDLFWDQLSIDPVNIMELLKAAELLSASSGPGQGRTEEELLRVLAGIARDCSEKLTNDQIPLCDALVSVPKRARRSWEVLQAMTQYASWCLRLRKPRDSFGGRRRIAAFEILSLACEFMDLPEAVALAHELEKSDRDDGVAASDFLMGYYETRDMPEKAVDSLNILQLKISLFNIHPLIWRRVLVANDLLLGDLHHIVNQVMGWDNSHMHAFKIGKIQYAGTRTVEDCGPPIRHEDSVTLGALIKRKGFVFVYQYDFGDNWRHEIKVENILPFDASMRLPVCLAGERACPIEDCGGVHGYDRVLETLRNPNKSELREFRRWIGKFDPEKFNLEEVNSKLEATI